MSAHSKSQHKWQRLPRGGPEAAAFVLSFTGFESKPNQIERRLGNTPVGVGPGNLAGIRARLQVKDGRLARLVAKA